MQKGGRRLDANLGVARCHAFSVLVLTRLSHQQKGKWYLLSTHKMPSPRRGRNFLCILYHFIFTIALAITVTLSFHEQLHQANVIYKHGGIHIHQQILLVQPSKFIQNSITSPINGLFQHWWFPNIWKDILALTSVFLNTASDNHCVDKSQSLDSYTYYITHLSKKCSFCEAMC